jgi:exonuclease VII small subunit
LTDPIIMNLLSKAQAANLNTQGLKAQILEMEAKGMHAEDAFNYLRDSITAALEGKKKLDSRSQKVKEMMQRQLQGRDPTNIDAMQQQEQEPFYMITPIIPVYQQIEFILFIISRLVNKCTNPKKPFWFTSYPLYKFIRDSTIEYMLNSEFRRVTSREQHQGQPKSPEAQEESERIKRLYNAWHENKQNEDGEFMVKHTTPTDTEWFSRYVDPMEKLFVEHIHILDYLGFIQLDLPSFTDPRASQIDEQTGQRLNEIDRSNDQIMIKRKGFIYYQMYLYCFNQQDQKGCMWNFLQLGINKDMNW